jgi:hypothetical protein
VDVDRDGVPQNSERSGDSFGGLRVSGRTARFHTATHHRSDRGESAPYPASACEHVVRAAAPNKGISGRSPAMTGSGGTDPPAITFSYAPGRGAVHALKAARWLSRRRAMRRLRRLQEDCGNRTRAGNHTRVLLVSSATPGLRHCQGRRCPDHERSVGTHRSALRDREDDPRLERRAAPGGSPGAKQAARGRAQGVARAPARASVRQGADRRRRRPPRSGQARGWLGSGATRN